MLDEVELLVRCRGPEVLALDNIGLPGYLSVLGNDGGAALLAEGRIGQHDIEPVSGVGGKRVRYYDGKVLVGPDAVEHQVHGAEPGRALDQFPALEGRAFELALFVGAHVWIVLYHVIVRGEEKPAGPASRIADRLFRLRLDHVDHGLDQRT